MQLVSFSEPYLNDAIEYIEKHAVINNKQSEPMSIYTTGLGYIINIDNC